MEIPNLKNIPHSRLTVNTFRGYHKGLKIGDGEFSHMENFTSDCYPVLATRPGREIVARPENPLGLCGKDALCYIDGSAFVMNDYRLELGLSDEPKDLVSMGAYVIIFPDKKYVNTADLSDHGDIEAAFSAAGAVSFSLCDMEGQDYAVSSVGTTAPVEPENLQLWLDTGEMKLKQWSGTLVTWVVVESTYVKIATAGIGKNFSRHDGVTITGLEGPLTDAVTGAALENTQELSDLCGSHVIWEKGEDFIVVTGLLEKNYCVTVPLSVSRRLPRMDFVIECGNRLWGCRYGLNNDGAVVNEIYASKLGDFRNWNCFMGASTDSYVMSLGSDGPFTGAVTHLDHPLFFKEAFLHKIYGSFPENFSLQTTPCRGVQKGSHKSLALVGEMLYYKSPACVCRYDGSLPVEVSRDLGDVRYHDAVAGCLGRKYYISMVDEQNQPHLFVYDTSRQLWHREDSFRPLCFATWDGQLYAIDTKDHTVKAMTGGEETVSWCVQTGDLGLEDPGQKYISGLTVRMALEKGGQAEFYVNYNFDDNWEYVCTVHPSPLGSFALPVRPMRCDHLRLKIIGRGEARIYGITRRIERGSDLP